MHFEPDHIYHVYNRGNNKTRIFFNPDNYIYILRKVKQEWRCYCDVCCYCLMPNHFHFMLIPNHEGCETITLKGKSSHLQKLSKKIGKTLSSYTLGINNQNNTTGNLFTKKTKAKILTGDDIKNIGYNHLSYPITCFHYIHNNPLEARLVQQLKDWPYSSWPDYYGFRNGNLCNKKLTMERIGFSENDFKRIDRMTFDPKVIDGIW